MRQNELVLLRDVGIVVVFSPELNFIEIVIFLIFPLIRRKNIFDNFLLVFIKRKLFFLIYFRKEKIKFYNLHIRRFSDALFSS